MMVRTKPLSASCTLFLHGLDLCLVPVLSHVSNRPKSSREKGEGREIQNQIPIRLSAPATPSPRSRPTEAHCASAPGCWSLLLLRTRTAAVSSSPPGPGCSGRQREGSCGWKRGLAGERRRGGDRGDVFFFFFFPRKLAVSVISLDLALLLSTPQHKKKGIPPPRATPSSASSSTGAATATPSTSAGERAAAAAEGEEEEAGATPPPPCRRSCSRARRGGRAPRSAPATRPTAAFLPRRGTSRRS